MCSGSILCRIKGFMMKISVCECHYCRRKLQYPKTLHVATRPAVSEVGQVVTRLFELNLLNQESQFGNFLHLHQFFVERVL